MLSASSSSGTGTSGAPEITPGAVAVRLVEQPRQRHHRTERMALGDQRQPRPFALGELGQRVGEIGAVRDRAEVAALAGTEPMAELVDRPQVDARGVEREAVPVVDAGVLTEAVQKDDDGARILRPPSDGSRPGLSGDR